MPKTMFGVVGKRWSLPKIFFEYLNRIKRTVCDDIKKRALRCMQQFWPFSGFGAFSKQCEFCEHPQNTSPHPFPKGGCWNGRSMAVKKGCYYLWYTITVSCRDMFCSFVPPKPFLQILLIPSLKILVSSLAKFHPFSSTPFERTFLLVYLCYFSPFPFLNFASFPHENFPHIPFSNPNCFHFWLFFCSWRFDYCYLYNNCFHYLCFSCLFVFVGFCFVFVVSVALFHIIPPSPPKKTQKTENELKHGTRFGPTPKLADQDAL